jgi:hypothetical protein
VATNTKAKFAIQTSVDPEQTLSEIKRTLKRYEATNLTTVEAETAIFIMFEMRNRRVKFVVPLPEKSHSDFKQGASNQYGKKGSFNQTLYEQAIRTRWRSLLLVIKAKLESLDAGIETFEEAFMAQILLPNGQTMSEWATPQIATAYDTGGMPKLLASGL